VLAGQKARIRSSNRFGALTGGAVVVVGRHLAVESDLLADERALADAAFFHHAREDNVTIARQGGVVPPYPFARDGWLKCQRSS
jgi:hypothetical protein